MLNITGHLKIKTTMGYHFTLTRMAIIKNTVLEKIETPLLTGLGLLSTMKLREISLCLLNLHSNSPGSHT